MKNTFLLLILGSLACHLAFSQSTAFPTPGMIYGEVFYCNYFDCPNGEYSNSSFYYASDTVFCGMTYHRMAFVQNPAIAFHIRVEDGKYFYYHPTLTPCTEESVLYDFTLDVGDKISTISFNWLTDSLIVFQKDSVTLDDGLTRKRLLLKPGIYNSPIFEWVEGIGDIQNGFLMSSDFEGGHEEMICVKNESGWIYHHPDLFLDCDSLLCRVPAPRFESICEEQTMHFENLSKFSDNYIWDFGDGTTSTEFAPSHQYAMPGCYQVELRAYSNCLEAIPFGSKKQVKVAVPNYWQPVFTPDFSFTSAFFLNAQKGWLVGENTIHSTTDGGLTWQHTEVPPPAFGSNQNLRGIYFYDELHGIAYAFNSTTPSDPGISTVLWTEDGGTNWQYSAPPIDYAFYHLIMTSPTTAYGLKSGDIYKTTDGGKTWHEMTNQVFYKVWEFQQINGDTIYYNGIKWLWPFDNAIILGKSTDGTNFSLIEITPEDFPELEGVNLNATSFYFINAVEGWITTNSRHILHTTDGGENWEIKAIPAHVTELKFINPQHGMAIGLDRNILETTDGGETWDITYCFPGTAFGEGFIDFDWPSEDSPLLVDKNGTNVNLLRLTDTPLFEDCMPLDLNSTDETELSPTIFPNPSANDVTLSFNLSKPMNIDISLFDIFGVPLKNIAPPKIYDAGYQSITFQIYGIPTGIYFIQLKTPEGIRAIKWAKAL